MFSKGKEGFFVKINHRYLNTAPSIIREFAETFAQIDGLLPFTIGEPDLNAPETVKDAIKKALDENKTHYASAKGLGELVEAIVAYFKRTQDLDLKADNVIITNGVTEAVKIAMDVFINEGDKIIVPSPFFGLYEMTAAIAGAELVTLDTSQTDFKLTPKALERSLDANPETRLVLLNYPNNPIGNTYTKDEIRELAEVIKRYDVFVISDEIYSDMIYDQDHYSIYNEIPNQTIYLNGPSKSYAMTGLRIGFIHMPDGYVTQGLVSHQTMVTSVSTPDQHGAIAAYNECDDFVVEARDKFKSRRDLLLEELPKIGLEFVHPAGAFYIFIKAPESYHGDDKQFALDLAHQAKVGVIPGFAFGNAGKGYVRFSFASSYESIQEGLKRLKSFVDQLA